MGRLRWAAKHGAVLLLFLGAAAAPTAEQAARDARSALDRSQYPEAQRIVDDALLRFGARDDEPVWALRVLRGEVLVALGKHAAAQQALKQEPAPHLRNSEPAVRRLLTLGNAAISLRDAKEAARRYEEARVIAAAHQPQMLADVYAAIAVAAPDLRQTEEYVKRAITAARKAGKPRVEASALAVLQYQYNYRQRFSDAIDVGEKALAAAKTAHYEKRIQQIAGNLGWSYIELGDYETAAELFTFAEATAARIGAEFERIAWLLQLGNLRFQKHDWTGAQRYYVTALPLARAKTHPDLEYIVANLATVSIETGRLDDARRYNAEALALKRAAEDREAELRSLIIEARIAAASNDLPKAIAILEGVARNAKEKTTQWEASGRLAEVFVKAQRFADAEKEFRRAIQTVREARREITTKELRFAFFNITADIFSAYIDFLIDRQRFAAALNATEEIRISALEDPLETRSSSRAVDAQQVARERGATIVSYWLGPRQSYVWKITPDAIRVSRREPDAKIAEAVESYRRDINARRSSLARGQRLYELLGRPSGTRVIIIPNGALHALNFETLVVPAPRPHYWIEDALISEASSIRMLASPQPRAHGGPPTLLLVGNPPPPDPAFPPLPRAEEEMRSVARHFASRAKILAGAAATPGAYRSASPNRFDYIHFVAHGIATRRRPLESAVILARDATSNYKLLARDVVEQPLAARLVTISSCHGAGTREYTGEGLVGLAWAFRRAGAAGVIAALWEVNDSATPQLMDRFYEKIAAGADPAAALRDAKLSLLRSKEIYRYARYWAPFVYYQ